MAPLQLPHPGHDRVDAQPFDVAGIGAGVDRIGKGQQRRAEAVGDPLGHGGLASKHRPPQVGKDPQLGLPGDERLAENAQRLLRNDLQPPVQADVADEFAQRRSHPLPFQPGQADEVAALRAVVEKAVRAPLGQVAAAGKAVDGAAGPLRPLEHEHAPRRLEFPEKGGDAQAGDAGADHTHIRVLVFHIVSIGARAAHTGPVAVVLTGWLSCLP